jgi:hypothetical protein
MMTIKALAEAVGKPMYTVNYAMATNGLCQDCERVGNARVFTDQHVEELRQHFYGDETPESPSAPVHRTAPLSLTGTYQ